MHRDIVAYSSAKSPKRRYPYWNEFHRPFESRLRLLDLPTYSRNNKNYWIQYNGDWALSKGNTFYEGAKQTKAALSPVSSFQTSPVQAIIHEEFHGTSGTVAMQSYLMSADFFAAARGHSINGCGVVTSVSDVLNFCHLCCVSGTNT